MGYQPRCRDCCWQRRTEAGCSGKVITAQKWLNRYSGLEGERNRWREERLGIKSGDEPDVDELTALLLSSYATISRGRRYTGMTASPLPISIRDIDAYLAPRPLVVDRELFEAAIFALDDEYRAEWSRQQQQVEANSDGDEG